MKKIDRVRFYVVMETYPQKDLALRQEVCVFDNQGEYLCKHPENIDVRQIWEELKTPSCVPRFDLEQYQKEASEKVDRQIRRKDERPARKNVNNPK